MPSQEQEHWQTPPRMLLSSAVASEIARVWPVDWDMASRLMLAHDTLTSIERATYDIWVTVSSTHNDDHAFLVALQLEM